MKKSININGELFDFDKPKIMGIVNATPDSFYSLSRIEKLQNLKTYISKMVNSGVDILDVGGYSTRPGAKDISPEDEIERVLPVIDFIKTNYPLIPIAIDTFRSVVAEKAVKVGASIVNDVSGGNLDDRMFETLARLKVPYILTHMRGTPKTMSGLTDYKNVVCEVLKEIQVKVSGLQNLGVNDIIIDPGFGFAKTTEQNFDLLESLEVFEVLERPILIGISRKGMIWKTLGSDPERALNGSTALNTKALIKGANVLRVHDVSEAREIVGLLA